MLNVHAQHLEMEARLMKECFAYWSWV